MTAFSQTLKGRNNRRRCRLYLFLAVIAFLIGSDVSAADPGPLVPPAVNQPASFKTFGRPIGTEFTATMEAASAESDPHTVRMDSSLTLTIQIHYKGQGDVSPQRPPRPPILGESYASHFTIGAPIEETKSLSWKYTFQLTPLSDKVDRIPAILFTYYSPLGYRTLELAGIDIKVIPRDNVRATELDNRAELPPAQAPVYRFAVDSDVSRRDDPWQLPALPVLALVFFAPPLACLAWYRLWQYLYPDEIRRLRRRRSRAAKTALRGLDLARAARPDVRPTLAASIVATYLKERLDLSALEPTPRETAEHLEQVGCSTIGVRRATEFFELCDSTRFGADQNLGREHVIGLGVDLIQTLEKETAA